MSEKTATPMLPGDYDPAEKPPPFGHPLKKHFALDPTYTNLNHGSYGSLPWPVLHAATQISTEIEHNPDRFHRITMTSRLKQARELIAPMIGANIDDIVFVPNVMAGINNVLRNFEWSQGDVIIDSSTTYQAVRRTANYLADRSAEPRPLVESVKYIFPLSHAQILTLFRERVREIKSAHESKGTRFTHVPTLDPSGAPKEGANDSANTTGNRIVAIIDSISSNPGVCMPWKEMVQICREEGVWSVVDAAHSLGQELGVNLSETQPDFWVSNCHKWLYAKRGCAIFYVPKRNQHIIKSAIPTPWTYVSPSSPEARVLGTNFVTQHAWNGAIDLTPYLTIPSAIAFRTWLGGEEAINDYCRGLARAGGRRLAEVLGTRTIDPTLEPNSDAGIELTMNMVDVQLPLPVEPLDKPGSVYTMPVLRAIYFTLQDGLLERWNVYAAHYYHAGAWWARCSAQVFNDVSDFERVGEAFKALCKEIEIEHLKKSPSSL